MDGAQLVIKLLDSGLLLLVRSQIPGKLCPAWDKCHLYLQSIDAVEFASYSQLQLQIPCDLEVTMQVQQCHWHATQQARQ